MSMVRPELWQLGGETAFAAYEEAFAALYRHEPLRDVLGRLVEFPSDACRHVCFTPEAKGKPRTVWSQERAERLPWIQAVLICPTVEIRPSHTQHGTEGYLTRVASADGDADELFMVYVRPIDDARVTFVTAFVPALFYWQAAMRGKRIYPPRTPKPKKPRRR